MRKVFAVSIFCVHDNKVLLIKHKMLNMRLPLGGEIEEGEDPLTAAKRELAEETGITNAEWPSFDLVSGSPNGLMGYEEHYAGSKGFHMTFAFVCLLKHTNIVSDGSWEDPLWLSRVDLFCTDTKCPENVQQLALRALLADNREYIK